VFVLRPALLGIVSGAAGRAIQRILAAAFPTTGQSVIQPLLEVLARVDLPIWIGVGGIVLGLTWAVLPELLRRRRSESNPAPAASTEETQPFVRGAVVQFGMVDALDLTQSERDEMEAQLTSAGFLRLWYRGYWEVETTTVPSRVREWRFSVGRLDGTRVECIPVEKNWSLPPSWPHRIDYLSVRDIEATYIQPGNLYHVYSYFTVTEKQQDLDFASFQARCKDSQGNEIVLRVQSAVRRSNAVATASAWSTSRTGLLDLAHRLETFSDSHERAEAKRMSAWDTVRAEFQNQFGDELTVLRRAEFARERRGDLDNLLDRGPQAYGDIARIVGYLLYLAQEQPL
jgi:hypothetical protein